MWGGCDGKVPFDDLQACEMANCVPSTRPRSPRPLGPRCDLEPERGPCFQNETRWFWDSDAQVC